MFYLFCLTNTQVSFPTVTFHNPRHLWFSPMLHLVQSAPLFLSLSLSPSFSPLHFYLLPFDIKRYWSKQLSSLNKCISTNRVCSQNKSEIWKFEPVQMRPKFCGKLLKASKSKVNEIQFRRYLTSNEIASHVLIRWGYIRPSSFGKWS